MLNADEPTKTVDEQLAFNVRPSFGQRAQFVCLNFLCIINTIWFAGWKQNFEIFKKLNYSMIYRGYICLELFQNTLKMKTTYCWALTILRLENSVTLWNLYMKN